MSGPGTEDVRAACHGPLREAAERLEETLDQSLHESVRKARGAHRTAREAAGLHRPAVPEEGARERILEYLEAVRTRVHGPLREAVESTRPVEAAATLLAEALEGVGGTVADLPEWAPAAELARNPSSARTGALARLAAGLAGPAEERRVRVRWIAGRHVALRLTRGVDRWTGLLCREWAAWLATLEVGWTHWASSVLQTLPPPGNAGATTRAWAACHAASAALDASLGELETTSPVATLRPELDSDLERWKGALDGDLEVGGTLLLRTEGPLPTPPRRRTDVAAWGRWEEEVVGRLALHDALLETVDGLERLAHRVPARLRADLASDWRRAGVRLAESLDEEAEALQSTPELDPSHLAASRKRVDGLLASLAEQLPRSDSFQEAAEKAGDTTVAAVHALLRGLPEHLPLHSPVDADQLPRAPTGQGRTLRLREVARAAFDALRVERLRTAPLEVVPLADSVSASKEQVREVVRFGFDAALAELGREEASTRERAAELAAEALGRAAEALRSAAEPLDRAGDEVAEALGAELHHGAATLLERALADRLQGRVLEARSRLAASWEGITRRTAAGTEAVLRAGRVQAARVRRLTAKLARRGRSMVSAPPGSVPTRRLLAAEEEVRSGLPLVYQRLFASEPVEDESLLAGRGGPLGEAETRWLQWREADGVPVLVTGRPGVGVSSFVRVFLERIRGRGGRVAHHLLETRLDTEEALARRVADLLELPAADTLGELAGVALAAPPGALPDLVALEGLEHLYLRVPGGTDVLERLLTFMAETEPRTFWIGTLTSSAWQILEVAEPTAVAQADRMDLPGLDAEALRQAILLRHRRSGVPLRWEEPTEGRRLLRRRLSRARGREARERLLEQDFFARLHRATGGNVRLALFQWLRAADFQAEEGTLTVRPRTDLDMGFLDALSPTQHFTLKAFLEHGTLTLEEHDRIFRLPRQESYQIFEALGSRHVIQAVPGSGEAGTLSAIADSVRYRINPLLLGGITATLTGRNILH